MMQDLVSYPFTFDVSPVTRTSRDKYQDKTTRDWYDGITIVEEPVSSYALADVQDTITYYKRYIRDTVLGASSTPSMEGMAAGFQCTTYAGAASNIYTGAWHYFCSLPKDDESWALFYQTDTVLSSVERSRLVSDTSFLLGVFELQFALRE